MAEVFANAGVDANRPRSSNPERARVAVERAPGAAEIDRAIEYLVNSAGPLGAAKARAVKAEKMLSHFEALKALGSTQKTADAKKWDARSSDDYVACIDEHAEAEGELSKLYALRQSAQAKVDVWRTECATLRGNRA